MGDIPTRIHNPNFWYKEQFLIIITILILADLAILLDIPFLRQILGFLFLAFLPGVLILQILRLNEIGSTEKIVLSVGLSVSFLMLFGLLINNLSLSWGYETPLATIPLLILFNLALIVFAIIGYKVNKEPLVAITNLHLSTSEKAFLIVPILFPALSIFGTHLMKTADNNIILVLLLFLIPTYVIFICFFNQKFPKRLYPIVIFLISLSLLLIFMLRFPHICGHDVQTEYSYYFRTTLYNLHWSVFRTSTLDACLSISLLPTIFQSILKIGAQEYLFKGVYVSICSVTPLVIYVISKKYVGELYAFLSSLFFMSQSTFLVTAGSPRTNIAIFFVTLAVMVFFHDKINPLKKRVLFIVFMMSCVLSHYATTYIFFFVLLFSWLAVEILSRRYTFKRSLSLTTVLLFCALIFFWYSQVTEAAFSSGVRFFENTLVHLNNFFLVELRSEEIKPLFGQELAYPIMSKVNLVFTWGTFILMMIGILTMLMRYKEIVSISGIKDKKPDFLTTKFELEFLVMVVACAGLLVIIVVLPYISVGYGMQRLYYLVIVFLSLCFVIGGLTLSNLSLKQTFKKSSIKNAQRNPFRKRGDGKNASEVRGYLIILLILIPYFLFVTGAMYVTFGFQGPATLDPEGKMGYIYIADQDIIAARWIGDYNTESQKDLKLYSDVWGRQRFVLAYEVNTCPRVYGSFFNDNKTIDDGYIYLRYANVVAGKVCPLDAGTVNITKYSHLFVRKSKIYANGGAELYS